MKIPMAKILIIDDSQAQLYSLKSIVEDEGHEAFTAGDWDHVLEAAKSQHPDLILLDILMPGMNGFQVKRKLHTIAETRKIPIIFVSIKNQESDIAWGLRQGAKAYITKPVNKKKLLSAINEVLAD